MKLIEFLNLLQTLRDVKQNPNWHKEGDVLQHSLQVASWALKESKDPDLILAAILHDVGKSIDTKGHDNYGAEMLEGKVSPKVLWLISNHMRFWKYIEGEMRREKKCSDLANHKWFPDLCKLARWDKIGRNPKIHYGSDRAADLAIKVYEYSQSQGVLMWDMSTANIIFHIIMYATEVTLKLACLFMLSYILIHWMIK